MNAAATTREAMIRAMQQAGHRRLILHLPTGEQPDTSDTLATFATDQRVSFQGAVYSTWDVWVPAEPLVPDDQGRIRRPLRAGWHLERRQQEAARGRHPRILVGTRDDLDAQIDRVLGGTGGIVIYHADEMILPRDGGEPIFSADVYPLDPLVRPDDAARDPRTTVTMPPPCAPDGDLSWMTPGAPNPYAPQGAR